MTRQALVVAVLVLCGLATAASASPVRDSPACKSARAELAQARADLEAEKDKKKKDQDRAEKTRLKNLIKVLKQDVKRECKGTPTPPPPAPDAPATDPEVASSTHGLLEFLYTGANPVQQGVTPGAIKPDLAAGVSGKVRTRAGAPIAGVDVRVLGHAELGHTQTDANGDYTLALNGGEPLTLTFDKDGFMTAQRTITLNWGEWPLLPQLVLIPPDPKVTNVNFSGGSAATQVVTGTVTPADDRPARTGTLLFPPGITATLELPGGGTQPAPNSDGVRIVEYTTGATGVLAMPAELPPTSGYTYAFGVTLDTELEGPAVGVRFSQPVPYYVENFLDLPIGVPAPLGSYDALRGVWVPEDSGVVLKIVSENSESGTPRAQLDLDSERPGGDAADDPELYAANGITNAERAALVPLFAPGQELMRSPLPHNQEAYDSNMGIDAPDGAAAPKTFVGPLQDCKDCPKGGYGSVSAERLVFDESLPVVGTPFDLEYSSQRAPGRTAERTARFRTDDPLPGPVKRIDTQLVVAGRRITGSFAATPGVEHTISWDGKDAFGRTVYGRQNATLRIGHVYDAVYRFTSRFGYSLGPGLTTNAARTEITLWTDVPQVLGNPAPDPATLGGWMPSILKSYDPGHGVAGADGGFSSSGRTAGVVETAFGNGGYCGSPGCSDGMDSSGNVFNTAERIAAAPDGTFYVWDTGQRRILQIGRDNKVRVKAGGGADAISDGIPATQAHINHVFGLAVGPDSLPYWVDDQCRVRRLLPNGNVDTVAGQPSHFLSCQTEHTEGALADQTPLWDPKGLTVGPDGSVYVTERFSVLQIGTDGRIFRIVGLGADNADQCNPSYPPAEWCGPKTAPWPDAEVTPIRDAKTVELGPDGSLYILTSSSRVMVRRPNGTIEPVTKIYFGAASENDSTCPLTPTPSIQEMWAGGKPALCYNPQILDIEVGRDGTVYLGQHSNVHAVGPDGILNNAAGLINTPLVPFDPGTDELAPALNAHIGGCICDSDTITLDPAGNLYVVDLHASRRIVRVRRSWEGFGSGDVQVASEDASEVYRFSQAGRHLSTRDALTGATKWSFDYDGAGRLTTITDVDGDVTTIQRDGSGKATAIVGPDGDETQLAIDANDDLTALVRPGPEAQAQRTYALGYAAGRLLTDITGPRGNHFEVTYGAGGRVARVDDPAGGFRTYAPDFSPEKQTVTETTAMGRVTVHELERLADGVQRRTVTAPDGTVTTVDRHPSDSRVITTPDGTVTTLVMGGDPRFGTQSPYVKSMTVDPPGSTPSHVVTTQRTLTGSQDPFGFTTLESRTTEANGNRTTTTVYARATRQGVVTTAGGRTATWTLGTKGRLVSSKLAAEQTVTYGYDGEGRLTTISQGAGGAQRVSTLDHDADGKPTSFTDAAGHAWPMSVDSARRLVSTGLPAPIGGTLQLGYDASGNPSDVTTPRGTAHSFGFSSVELLTGRTPPALGVGDPANATTSSTYNVDRQQASFNAPGTADVAFGYLASGRPSSVTADGAGGALAVGYDAQGRVDSLDGPEADNALGYDGLLGLTNTWTTGITGSLAVAFDADHRASSRTVAGDGAGDTIDFGYDADSLLSSISGAMAATLTRDPDTGRLTKIETGSNVEDLAYDADFGELTTRAVSHSGGSKYAVTYTRDKLGRVKTKAESVDGAAAVTTTYTYDAAGRLTQAAVTGGATTNYTWDRNNNRTTGSAVYDDQDRLSGASGVTYTYTPAGKLATKTDGGDTTTYTYDALDRLRSVDLPSTSDDLTYRYDALGRRVERKVGATVTERYLYDGLGRLVATLDAADDLVATFAYLPGAWAPVLMKKGGVTYRIVADHAGSVRLVVDTSTGAIAQELEYDPFGKVLADTSPGFQPLAFAGGLYDPATGLVRMGARDYDPDNGRFTTKDPIGFAGGESSLYAYCGGDPINCADPTGFGPGTYVPGTQPINPLLSGDITNPRFHTYSSPSDDVRRNGSVALVTVGGLTMVATGGAIVATGVTIEAAAVATAGPWVVEGSVESAALAQASATALANQAAGTCLIVTGASVTAAPAVPARPPFEYTGKTLTPDDQAPWYRKGSLAPQG